MELDKNEKKRESSSTREERMEKHKSYFERYMNIEGFEESTSNIKKRM